MIGESANHEMIWLFEARLPDCGPHTLSVIAFCTDAIHSIARLGWREQHDLSAEENGYELVDGYERSKRDYHYRS